MPPECCTFTAMQTFADRLAAALTARGWSQNRLEREAKLSRGHVNRIIHGKGARAAPETLVTIARVLGIDHDWLTTGRGSMFSSGEPAALPVSPASETRVTLDAVADLVNSAYDPTVHLPSDAMLVGEALQIAATFRRAHVDPTAYVRRLLDAAARERQRGRKVAPADLPTVALGVIGEQLDESDERVKRLREEIARAYDWMRGHGIPTPEEDDEAATLAQQKASVEPPRRPESSQRHAR